MDMFKPSRIAMVVAATAGVPYMFSHQGETSSTAESALHATAQGLDDAAGMLTAGRRASDVPLEGIGIHHISQVIRFDVTMNWVLGTWPRVTTGLADASMQGYRVPLVTGTRPQDVAGALTYYFNKDQQVERILLLGSTGDPAELIAFLNHQFAFERITINDPALHLYQRKEGRKVTGELRIKSLGVVRQDTPLHRWDLSLVIDRPKD